MDETTEEMDMLYEIEAKILSEDLQMTIASAQDVHHMLTDFLTAPCIFTVRHFLWVPVKEYYESHIC